MVAPNEGSPPGKPKPRKKASKPGRPTEYDPVKCPAIARELCMRGTTDAELAKLFGVVVSTLYDWRLAHPEFAAAVKEGKRASDDRVEESLFARATGYEHEDTHIAVHEGVVIKTPIVKKYAPDPTSMIFWLKNRRPDRWRERIDVSVEAEGLVKLTPEEQARLWAANYRANAPIADRIVGAIEMRNVTGTGDSPKSA